MRAVSACLLVRFLAVSAVTPYESFRYKTVSFRRSSTCRLCFAEACTTLSEPRCAYYAQIDDLMPIMQKDGDITVVDGMMYDLVEGASSSWEQQECLPFISKYTDCTKENMCVGCKTCSCTAEGTWKCNEVQRCVAKPELHVDHDILIAVINKLRQIENNTRRKRNNEYSNNTSRSISLLNIAEWMYGERPDLEQDYSDLKERDNNQNEAVTDLFGLEPSEIETAKESDIIDFEELLKNNGIDNQIYKRRNSKLTEYNDTTNDYIGLDYFNFMKTNDSDQFLTILNAIEEGNDNNATTELNAEASTFVIDLLVPSKKENVYSANKIKGNLNIITKIEKKNLTDKTIAKNAVNILKRDVSSVSEVNDTTPSTTTVLENESVSEDVSVLKSNVLIPLMTIIQDKQKELKDMLQIKDNLIKYLNSFNSSYEYKTTEEPQVINGSNTYFSIYNMDLFPRINYDLRVSNPNILEKLLYKLKRDIYEVVRDIAVFHKYSKSHSIPDDLKRLVQAMKHYVVRKQGSVNNLTNNNKDLDSTTKNFRRQNVKIYSSQKPVKGLLIDILETIDQDIDQHTSFTLLSHSTKKIVDRVVTQIYENDISMASFKGYDPEYNLTKDLRDIGSKWMDLTENIKKSSLTDKLYTLKLLHLVLSTDVNKFYEAIGFIENAPIRRMINFATAVDNENLDQIKEGLSSINKKVQLLIKYHNIRTGDVDNMARNGPKKALNVTMAHKTTKKVLKKESFINKIRNMFRGSKKEIVNLVNNKVPKSKIVKTLAQKTLREMKHKNITDYKNTMIKWQNALNVKTRNKRDATKLMNILPKYLRGKVNPSVVKKMKSKKKSAKGNLFTFSHTSCDDY